MRRCRSGRLAAVGLLLVAEADAAPQAVECAHSLCVESPDVPLDPKCDPCVAEICRNPEHEHCCMYDWDFECVALVLETCGDPMCEAGCLHSPCQPGDPLDPTCHPCVASICASDPSCCESAWSEVCAAQVEALCGLGCLPSSDACEDAVPLPSLPKISVFGTLTNATDDGCAELDYDSCKNPDVWYSYAPHSAGRLRINTCETNRMFGIDTILSVHAECPGTRDNELASNDDWKVADREPDPDHDPDACEAPEELGDYLDSSVSVAVADENAPVAPGQAIRIRVTHARGNAASDFQLTLTPEPPDRLLRITALALAAGFAARRRA